MKTWKRLATKTFHQGPFHHTNETETVVFTSSHCHTTPFQVPMKTSLVSTFRRSKHNTYHTRVHRFAGRRYQHRTTRPRKQRRHQLCPLYQITQKHESSETAQTLWTALTQELVGVLAAERYTLVPCPWTYYLQVSPTDHTSIYQFFSLPLWSHFSPLILRCLTAIGLSIILLFFSHSTRFLLFAS